MNTINDKEQIKIGGRTLFVDALTAQEIRKRIVLRLKRDARITEELRRERMLPGGHRNQTASLTGSNYCRHDMIDQRAIGYTARGMVKALETRFPDHLKREWTA